MQVENECGGATMSTFQVLSKADGDGVLHFDIPVGTAGAEFEVVVVLSPKNANRHVKLGQDSSLPHGFIEATAGSIDDDTFVRHPPGGYEKRVELE
jgi:hypothetical protein